MAYDLESFNPAQKAAVEYCDGPSLVIAGAGSGKTRVLTHKIAYLMSELGLQSWEILALTFTNKAANEMKQRIGSIVGVDNARHLWMGTFHSIFLRILRAEHEAIGFSANFTIYDSADSKSLVKDIIKGLGLDDKKYKPSSVLSRISNAKNHLVTSDRYVNSPDCYQTDCRSNMPETGNIYKRYSNRCRQSDAMDFDDILLYTYLLFENNPEIRQKYAERFRYVLVDEYQDTNYAQHQIVWQITRDSQKVCVVGDDAQSIYSFRGANIDNILTFKDLYKGSKLFKLEQNYRSTQIIVDAANSLIKKNRGQIEKAVFSENSEGERITVSESYSDIEEGQIVMRQIQNLRRQENCEYSDFAILYRTNAQSRVFEEALRKQGMPYKIYGGLSFYQRKEIKDIIAYFRLAVNPNDEEAFKRVINYPARGIGDTTLSKISSCAEANNVSLWTVVNFPNEYQLDVNKGTMGKIQVFCDLISKFREMAASDTASEVGQVIVKESGIIGEIYSSKDPEDLARQENVEELLGGMQEFVDSRREQDINNLGLSDYLSEVSLISDLDSDKDDEGPKVTLMTIHSAKGLEFPTVFVVGLEENLFPSQMATTPREMEEERRLFYVALTRAERHCFISYAKSRFRFGKTEFSNPSRFISDIDPKFLDMKTGMKSSRSYGGDIELPWNRSRQSSFDEPEYMRPSMPVSRMNVTRINNTESRPSFTPHRTAVSTPLPTSGISRVTSDRVAASAPKSPEASAQIAVGKHIEHQRFGIGLVENIEGEGENMKATINFNNLGKKQLLLKFARFTVID